MMKCVVAAVFAASLYGSPAAAQSIVQKPDWQEAKFETFLPPWNHDIPWLNVDLRSKAKKADILFGCETNAVAPLLPHQIVSDKRMSSNIPVDQRRM